jgi:transcriptional regulator with XRE-family HTH domain
MGLTPKKMGARIRKVPEAKGLSQYALAKDAGVSREHVRRLEAGESDPTIGMLQRLAKALGVPLTELLG